ncbi:MAG: LacI family DNA-binding transcriptional regulator [Brevundimonas sp.]|uniref:LacI family DNA-binding transcriptional regulator n=1 Tax=Brevundimonas sp. TaxID=1871086 RepID=UPI002AB9CDD2|nr:LacI family DNA-binding transcriptional regulator [Brevundimonas sp.]MDZ4111982.1 LacI family DNA-binding transcriptional regulator [Brevundimonas sp.]
MTARIPTIDDVALHSGVGRTTVSRVLNGGPNVRAQVRDRVLASVAALNYRVNPQARSLAGGGSRMLALVLASDLEAEPNSFYASALELGALRECLVLGYQLMTRHVPQQSPDRREQVLELMTTQRCQGLILTPPFADDATLIGEIRRQGCQVATISPGGPGRSVADGVGIDDEAGGYDIARHLLDLGHRRFAFISGIEGHLSAERRLDGLKRALRERGLDPEVVTVLRGDFTFRSGSLLATRLFDHPDRPTALVCANDDMAAGALSAAHGRGLDVPGHLSITGFDDTPVSEIVWPPLATVHQPLKDMSGEAVRIIAGRLAGKRRDADWRFTVLPHAVVPRASAGRAESRFTTVSA